MKKLMFTLALVALSGSSLFGVFIESDPDSQVKTMEYSFELSPSEMAAQQKAAEEEGREFFIYTEKPFNAARDWVDRERIGIELSPSEIADMKAAREEGRIYMQTTTAVANQ